MAEPPACAPPASLLKHDEPLFVGFDGADSAAKPGTAAGGQLGEMVNSMLPPREWTEPTGTWMQYVSKAPASRTDVIAMQEALDAKLLERQARDAGICPVREDLYAQCFDELIRQLTLDGPERGLLLLRVRDEVRMTVDAYKFCTTLRSLRSEEAAPGRTRHRSSMKGAELEAEGKDLRTASSNYATASRPEKGVGARPADKSARARRRQCRPHQTGSASSGRRRSKEGRVLFLSRGRGVRCAWPRGSGCDAAGGFSPVETVRPVAPCLRRHTYPAEARAATRTSGIVNLEAPNW